MRQAVALGIGAAVVVLGGGLAYAASRPATTGSGGAAGGGAGSGGGALPAGSPQGLTASSKTATGWELTIEIQLRMSGLSYQGFFGDVVRVKLPPGCHWRTVTGTGNTPAMSPPSGTDDFVFTLVELPMTYSLAYTDASRSDLATTLSFQVGATFESTTSLASGDYVILAIQGSDLLKVVQTITTLYGSIAAALDQQEYAQEAATVVEAANVVGNKNMTPEALLTFIATMGPWADKFAADVHSFVPFKSGATLPAWWPSDDTGASSEFHLLYRYVGPGIEVSALPFPVTAWKRTE
jgi:hypothetical protein